MVATLADIISAHEIALSTRRLMCLVCLALSTNDEWVAPPLKLPGSYRRDLRQLGWVHEPIWTHPQRYENLPSTRKSIKVPVRLRTTIARWLSICCSLTYHI